MFRAMLRVLIVTLLAAVLAITILLIYGRKRGAQSTDPSVHQSLVKTDPASRLQWETIFFEELEKRTKAVDIPSLRAASSSADHLELRFWYDVLPGFIHGFIIRRSDNAWSAVEVRQETNGWPSRVYREDLGQPKSGWDNAWKQITAQGLLELPDGNQTDCSPDKVLDGSAIVVETMVNRQYRTYRYSNPAVAKCNEANRLMSLEGIIFAEFNRSVVVPNP